MGANNSNVQFDTKNTSTKRQIFQKKANERKLNQFADAAAQGSFEHKNAFEMSWNETDSCFGSNQECAVIPTALE